MAGHIQYRAHISGPQTPGSTPPLFYITNVGCKPLVKPGVWRPEMCPQYVPGPLDKEGFIKDGNIFLSTMSHEPGAGL
jgi:hypothetical protein